MADIWWHNVYTEVDGSEWHVCNLGLGLGPNNSDCDCDSECDTACVFPCQVLVEKSLGTPCLFFLIWWRGNPMLCTWQKVLIPPFTVTLDMSMFPRPLYHLTRVTRILASLIIIFRKRKKEDSPQCPRNNFSASKCQSITNHHSFFLFSVFIN